MAVRKGQSFRQVAEEFGIKKSSLWRAVRKDGEGKKLASYSEMSQSRLIFTIEEEVELVQYLLTASRIGFPLDTATVKSLAYTLAIRNGNRVPDNWEKNKQAGKDWMTAFKSRHRQLSIRTPEATSIARATAFNKHNVGTFFEKLRRLYQEHTLTPERIYNVDETALTTSQRPQKVVAEAGVKQVAQLVSHERGETVTMLGIINGIGNCLPPCLVFPRKNYKNHMLFGAPPGTQGFCNPSGWMTQEIFVQCLHHICFFLFSEKPCDPDTSNQQVEEAVAETTGPAAAETTGPAAAETTGPAAAETTGPAAAETIEPAATETTGPAAAETIEPAAAETREPIATETTEPAAEETTEPAAEETTESGSVKDGKTYTCIICTEPFCTSRPGEVWIQCGSCLMWCHEECAEIGTLAVFTCDFCK
ncbi:hypothetical protein V1264_000581 [Littorina saxatilis]|uniref:HTH CENPB-type domain-containing protein n=2 Tax=Littorina saxatilis TaxID=31220 RepID=A0AAN9GMW6_9CAEN